MGWTKVEFKPDVSFTEHHRIPSASGACKPMCLIHGILLATKLTPSHGITKDLTQVSWLVQLLAICWRVSLCPLSCPLAGGHRSVSRGPYVGRRQGGSGGLQWVHQDYHPCHHPRRRLCQKTSHVLGGKALSVCVCVCVLGCVGLPYISSKDCLCLCLCVWIEACWPESLSLSSIMSLHCVWCWLN